MNNYLCPNRSDSLVSSMQEHQTSALHNRDNTIGKTQLSSHGNTI